MLCKRVVNKVNPLAEVDPFITLLQKLEVKLHQASEKINQVASDDPTEILQLLSLFLNDVELSSQDTRLVLKAFKSRHPIFQKITQICKDVIRAQVKKWVEGRLHQIKQQEVLEEKALQEAETHRREEYLKALLLQALEEEKKSSSNLIDNSASLVPIQPNVVQAEQPSSSWRQRFWNLKQTTVGAIARTGSAAIHGIKNTSLIAGNLAVNGSQSDWKWPAGGFALRLLITQDFLLIIK